MSMERIPVVICDICGEISKVEEHGQYDPTYTLPDGWKTGRNSNVHICPSCNEKLSQDRPANHWPEGVR